MDKSSAKKDGSLGYVIKGQMEDKFEKALFKLKEGSISDVVKTDYGYHIIKSSINKMILIKKKANLNHN